MTFIKRPVKRLFSAMGYDVVPKGRNTDLTSAFRRVQPFLGPLETVIDVGASDGRWTAVAMPYLNARNYLLIEANPVHEPSLEAFAQQHLQVQVVLAAAGDTQGEIYFDASDPFSGVASNTVRAGYVRLPVTTIDHEVKQRDLAGPYVIKLDTHGFEVPILEGAEATLANTSLAIIEAYLFRISDSSLLFFELCAYMAERGFLPIDFCDPLFRVHDGAFWQMDLFFLRADNPVFAYRKWA
jgi:FkbM family methyltransferase